MQIVLMPSAANLPVTMQPPFRVNVTLPKADKLIRSLTSDLLKRRLHGLFWSGLIIPMLLRYNFL